jgi:hypothetical protein
MLASSCLKEFRRVAGIIRHPEGRPLSRSRHTQAG